jgi:hypothetical protein
MAIIVARGNGQRELKSSYVKEPGEELATFVTELATSEVNELYIQYLKKLSNVNYQVYLKNTIYRRLVFTIRACAVW